MTDFIKTIINGLKAFFTTNLNKAKSALEEQIDEVQEIAESAGESANSALNKLSLAGERLEGVTTFDFISDDQFADTFELLNQTWEWFSPFAPPPQQVKGFKGTYRLDESSYVKHGTNCTRYGEYFMVVYSPGEVELDGGTAIAPAKGLYGRSLKYVGDQSAAEFIGTFGALAPYPTLSDHGKYLRVNNAKGTLEFDDTPLLKTGGTMTNSLILHSDPTKDMQAATKRYVDNTALLKTGGAMTGALTLCIDPIEYMHAATKRYVDYAVNVVAASINNTLGISTAAVGQTIKVKAVDYRGKPTEWEAVDMQPLTITIGDTTYTYDGTQAVSITIDSASGVNF